MKENNKIILFVLIRRSDHGSIRIGVRRVFNGKK